MTIRNSVLRGVASVNIVNNGFQPVDEVTDNPIRTVGSAHIKMR